MCRPQPVRHPQRARERRYLCEVADTHAMDRDSREFFYELLQTPSPTGWEQMLQRKIEAHYRGVADRIEPDIHGNLFLALNPDAKRKIMLAGHCDQIGFLVKYI